MVRHNGMSHCAYIYTPKFSETSVRSLISGLGEGGVTITHLGKSDPPKRWSGGEDAAVLQVVGGTDLTNWTFLRDANRWLDFSIELHRDPRWEHDTVSFSGPEAQVREAAEFLAHRIDHYLVLFGLLGGGKAQAWRVISLGAGCPERLKRQFTNAELGAPPNGGPAVRSGNSGVSEGPPSVS
jgi:hypothetical protein